MGALEDARRHLNKAREFLEAAADEVEFERFNAATSNAVTSGINYQTGSVVRSQAEDAVR